MKYESVLNQPGGMSRTDGETRIVGFRVKISEILDTKEPHNIISPDVLMEELAITYLKNNGYEVKKNETKSSYINNLPKDFNVNDDQYQEWKKYFEKLNEVDKIDYFNAMVANYLLKEDENTAQELAFFMTCTMRWTNEKNLEDF